MSLYDKYLLPHLINCTCGTKQVCYHRKQIVPLATGRVLEIGMGSAINLQYYNPDKVEFVWGLEPSDGMRAKAKDNLAKSATEVRWLDLPSEEIPLEDNSVDSIVLTYTLCTIPDWLAALQQMRRVLKPNGKLLFSEHGQAPTTRIQKWQDKLNPLWKPVSGGCNINRPIDAYIQQGGFNITSLETSYMRGTPKVIGYNYRGIAVHA